jgi:hypothetical protein
VETLTDEQRRACVDAVRVNLESRGYSVGPTLTQNHYGWLVDGFGYAGTYEEYQAAQDELFCEEQAQHDGT